MNLKKMNKGNVVMLCLMLYMVVGGEVMMGVIIGLDLPVSVLGILLTSQVMMFGVPFLVYLLVSKKPLREVIPMTPLDLKNLGYVVGITLVSMPIIALISALGSLFVNNYVQDVMEHVVAYPFWLTMLAIGMFPAFFEEAMFRGAIYTEHSVFSPLKMALVNGLFFGIMHLNIQQFLYAAVIGVLFSYFRTYTKSMIAPMLSHFMINGLNVLLMYVVALQDIPQEQIEAMATDVSVWQGIVVIALIALAMVPLLILLLKKMAQHNQVDNGEQPLKVEVDKPKMVDLAFVLNIALFVGVVVFRLAM